MKRSNSLPWSEIILPALTVTLGLQVVRALPPYLQYLLGDRLGWSAVEIGLTGVLVFSTGFLFFWLNRWLGLRRLLLLSAGGLGLVRLAIQVWRGDPLGDMSLTIVGTVLFIIFLSTHLVLAQWQQNPAEASYRYALAVLLGLAFDTTLHGLFLTYDFIWQATLVPLAFTIGLVLLQWATLRASLPTAPPHPAPVEGKFLITLPWIAIGPFLFLQLLVFQNQAQSIALTAWSLPVVFTWVLVSQLIGLGLVSFWLPRRTGAIVVGLVLIISLWPLKTFYPITHALTLLTGQISAAVLLTVILRSLGESAAQAHYTIGTPHQPKEGLRNTTVVHGLSMLLLVSLLFGYYVTFNLRVPYEPAWLLTLAAAVMAASAIGAAHSFLEPIQAEQVRPLAAASTLLLLFPLGLFLTWPNSTSPPQNSGPLRVMTYNVHNGINTAGQLDVEALARVIEAEQPDIIALQEVSRGWVVNGSLEMLTWLSNRLNLPYGQFTPSSDILWGQAVLSRYPILEAEDYPLPPRDLPLKRSFGYLQIDTGRNKPFNLINTHFHHRPEDSAIRLTQVETVLDFLAGRELEQFTMTGDLNATPDTPEIQRLYQYGFQDVIIKAGLKPGHTFHADQPHKRLDYLLISPDLAGTNVVIPPSTASDHLGIATTIERR